MNTPINIKHLNTFAISAQCEQFYQPESLQELITIADELSENTYVLGEGSNTLFVDEHTPPIIKPKLHGIEITSTDQYYLVTAAASENWHELVIYCLEHQVYGLENLALIPGSVGAAPVQNIGAYGVELSDYCTEVHWFCFTTKALQTLSTEACQFGYRDSIFKHQLKGKGLITSVTLKLPKQWQAKLSYAGLNTLPVNVTANEVFNNVVSIRQAKLPDPAVIPNAGSFFKNPIVTYEFISSLKEQYKDIPYYSIDEHSVKLAAGWLIEQAGLKGYQQNGVGVHNKQALVLVNFSSDSGLSIIALARMVVEKVSQQFGITLEPEVRLVSASGETSFQELVKHG